MLIKDFKDEKKVILYLSNQEYVYNDIILCEHNGKKYGILINFQKTVDTKLILWYYIYKDKRPPLPSLVGIAIELHIWDNRCS